MVTDGPCCAAGRLQTLATKERRHGHRLKSSGILRVSPFPYSRAPKYTTIRRATHVQLLADNRASPPSLGPADSRAEMRGAGHVRILRNQWEASSSELALLYRRTSPGSSKRLSATAAVFCFSIHLTRSNRALHSLPHCRCRFGDIRSATCSDKASVPKYIYFIAPA